MSKKIPILYIFLYSKLKKETRTEHIFKSKIYEIFARFIMRKGGLPKHLSKYIIKDLEYYNLLERVNHKTYKVLQSDCDKFLNQIFLY